jgi:microcystin-dependent protein
MSTPAGTWSSTSTPVPTQQAKFTSTNVSAKRLEGAGVYQRHPLGASALLVPTGSITGYAGITVPGGWLMCNGAAIDRTIYADLFEAIGTTYGNGDGETTFNIPNLLGRTIIGFNPSDADFDALGEIGGEKRHTLTVQEMPSHNHGVTDPGHAHGVTDPGHAHQSIVQDGIQYGPSSGLGSISMADEPQTTAATSTNTTGVTVNTAVTGISIQYTGGGQSHNVLDPYMALRYIIKV